MLYKYASFTPVSAVSDSHCTVLCIHFNSIHIRRSHSSSHSLDPINCLDLHVFVLVDVLVDGCSISPRLLSLLSVFCHLIDRCNENGTKDFVVLVGD